MEYLKIYPENINSRSIERAVRILKDGGLVIYPTDTLYAVGCDALNSQAIADLCRLKGINPERQLLSVVCSSLSQAAEYAKVDNVAFRYLKRYLPGPYTFILPSAHSLPKVFKGRKSVGVRIPDNPISQALAEALGNPVLTSSVEVDVPEEATAPESLEFIYEGKAKCIIDGGEGGLTPSTVVDLTDSSSPVIVREGPGEFEV